MPAQGPSDRSELLEYQTWEKKIHSHYITVGPHRYHYKSLGSGEKIIFLHGFPEFWYYWKDQMTFFSKTHQTIALDLKGYNQSASPDGVGQYTGQQLTQELIQILEQIKEFPNEQFVVVGHDWGGNLAWRLGMQRPDLIKKLVILNAPVPQIFSADLAQDSNQKKKSLYFFLLANPWSEWLLKFNNFNLMAKLYRASDPHKSLQVLKSIWEKGLNGMLNYYRALPYTDQSSYSKVQIPTLLLWGARDNAFKVPKLKQLKYYVPQIQFKLFQEAGHSLVPYHNQAVNQTISSFIK